MEIAPIKSGTISAPLKEIEVLMMAKRNCRS